MAPRPKERKAGTRTQRELTPEQLNAVVLEYRQRTGSRGGK